MGTTVQARPSQCSISAWSPAERSGARAQQQWNAMFRSGPPAATAPTAHPPAEAPAAHALSAEVAATALRLLKEVGLGLIARAHLWPFQRRMRVRPTVPFEKVPTAHALPAEVAVTPERTFEPAAPAGFGLSFRC